MGIIKTISGIPRHGPSFERITDPSVPNKILLNDPLETKAFGDHFPKASFDIT